jgi:cytohesin
VSIAAVAVLLLAGCGNSLLSKEQRQVNDAVTQAVNKNPSCINAPFADGLPPLHVALYNNLTGLFHWLLARGADANVRDSRGDTILHAAVIFDLTSQSATLALLKKGADVNGKRSDGGTPLHTAAFLSRTESVKTLLAAGADPNAPDELGKTPLHEAAVPQPTASPENATGTIHLLVAGGANPAARKKNGDTPLHMAALIGSVTATRALLKEGAQVDAPGCGGGTALHVAAQFAQPQVAEVLLLAGANPNRRDDQGLTPLGRALHAPAFTTMGGGAAAVDTGAVAALLKRYGALERDAAPRPGPAP